MFLRLVFLVLSVVITVTNAARAGQTVYFQCSGSADYQLIFEHDSENDRWVQTLQEPDRIQHGAIAHEQQTILTEIEISEGAVTYTKNNYRFSINRGNGIVLRDNDTMPVTCDETPDDYFAAIRADIETAKTTTTEFWSPTTGYADTKYARLGMLATDKDICQLFLHLFFEYRSADYRALDTINSDFDWEGINAASIWISQKFRENGIQLRRFGLMENIHNAANANLAKCLAEKEKETPGFYDKLTRHFLGNLGYRGVSCIEQQYRIEQAVDDSGNIIEKRVPVGSQSCIDFNYNSGRLNDWNTSTFTLMLIWKEAHPVLEKIFDKGEGIMVARLADMERRRLAEEAAERARKEAAAAARTKAAQDWSDYQARQKTLMEQVYNFATTGYPEGMEGMRWVEEDACVLSDGNRRIDNRSLNMTAFRMYKEFIGTSWYTISTDMNVRFSTIENIPIERLQRAWGLAFQQCPGQTSAF